MTVYLEGAKTFHLVTLTEKPKQNDLLLRRWNLQSSTRISFMKVPFLGKIRVAIKAAPPDSTKIASRHRTNKQIGTQRICRYSVVGIPTSTAARQDPRSHP